MGRASQVFWYLQADPLPGAEERKHIFTAIDPESDELKTLRRKHRARIREEKKLLAWIFSTLVAPSCRGVQESFLKDC